MKKENKFYVIPEMEVITVRIENNILSGGGEPPIGGGEGTGDDDLEANTLFVNYWKNNLY